MTSPDRARIDRVRAACTRFLQGAPATSVSDRLRELADLAQSQTADGYGEGGDLAELERVVAELLGKPAAVFMPSGTMAQQAALRVWCDRTGHPAVALHGMSHLVVHEQRALEVLHGVRMEALTSDRRPLTAADLAKAPGPFGALTVELPLRDAGYLLPSWDELVALTDAARERGIPVHLDGARLWESQPFYARSHADIAALADSVYVSFYKGLGGIAGAVLVGPDDVVGAARQWQHRHGGRLYSLYPYVIAARQGLDRVGEFGAYRQRAHELATALCERPEFRVFPEPPQTNGFVLYADVPASAWQEAALQHAESTGTWTMGWAAEAGVPGWSRTEIVVGPASLEWTVSDAVAVLCEVVRDARGLRTPDEG